MSVAATATTLFTFKSFEERRLRRIRVDITGLASGANTIPHGITQPNNQSLGATPKEEAFLPTSVVVAHRTSAADATNLYYTVDSGAGTTASVYVTV